MLLRRALRFLKHTHWTYPQISQPSYSLSRNTNTLAVYPTVKNTFISSNASNVRIRVISILTDTISIFRTWSLKDNFIIKFYRIFHCSGILYFINIVLLLLLLFRVPPKSLRPIPGCQTSMFSERRTQYGKFFVFFSVANISFKGIEHKHCHCR